ncbi:prolyl oligopeptidase family serine peptidase [Piscinibacter koreensis]|uniref:Prolyl oligopeptidase family serine peptidase n=1 Tax=Piscinibacter koreensis TaxID=2742824 RepID=A0A7Y6NRJ6_9BURK|nr:prolyl oligopeptidase family serine peptidase [Schlegelella koreensis]NUZ07995.1 prolyl oligopeptidase family serine peptidase [Schlegelella koreensis]
MHRVLHRMLPVVMLAILLMSSSLTFAITAPELRASMRDANQLPSPTNVDERAARGNYLPYTGYFEETYTTGAGAGRKARFYIPQGSFVRNYFLAIALPSGTDVETFLVNSGWIDTADANTLPLMILLPENGQWGPYAQEQAYIGRVLNGYQSGRRWYSIYGEFYLAGYGDGGDRLQQWAGENPLFVISQAYFDSNVDAAALAAAGEYYYVPSGQTALTSPGPAVTAPGAGVPCGVTFECVKKKDVPVPTDLFGSSTPAGAIAYWKYSNECGSTVMAGAGALGSDVCWQNKVNSKALATGYSSVVSRVSVLNAHVEYVDPRVTKQVYDSLLTYTRYTNSSAWSNALGWKVNRNMPGFQIVDMIRPENGRNVKRQYWSYVPAKVQDKRLFPNGAPVIYAFGGNGNAVFQYFESSQYIELADTYGFSVVMPGEHTGNDGVTTTWSINENDYQFILAVMQDMNGKYGQYFDQKRIYAFGHSQGGALTNFLSERDPNLFTAYSVNAGGGRNFPAGTPPAPMYGIYGEYDSANILSGRTGWFARNGLNVADGVTTDPFDLPARFNNPVQYLIYPDTPQYPGDQYETTTWYNASGMPMFAETLAYGKEHNNTVSSFRRTWLEWYNHWSRDSAGNRIYAAATPPASVSLQVVPGVLNLRSTAGLVTSVITVPAGVDLRQWSISGLTMAGAPAVSTAYASDGRSMVVTFNKAQLSSLPAGDNVPFTISGQFNRDGFQWPLSAAAAVKVMK